MTSQIRVDEITNRSGLGTVTIYDNGFEFTGVTTFTEDVDITGGLTIGGVLTYEDVTNIDSVGVVTARGGVKVPDSQKVFLGTGDDLQIYHNSNHSIINNSTGDLRIESDRIELLNNASNEFLLTADANGAVKLYYDNSTKLETTSSGVKVSGSFPDFIIHDTDTTNDNFRILHNGGGTQLQVDPNNVSSGSYLLAAIDNIERLRIASDGKVGINETSPTALLDINHPNTEQGLKVRSRYGNIATAMVKFDSDPQSDGGDGNVLHLHGGSSRTDSEILHIDSTGVGDIFDIRGDGLTRVYKQLQLEHSSNVAKIIFNEYGANDIKAQIEMDQINGSSGQLIFRTQNSGTLSERLRITSDGNVGINETSPAYKLSVGNGDIATMKNVSAAGGNAVDMLRFRVENSTNTTQKATLGGISAETVSNWGGALTFHTKSANGTPNESVTERLRITSDGKMGVGTASPNHRLTLHNSGTGTFDALNITSGLTNSVGLQLGIDSASNVFFWHTANGGIKFATNNVERARVTNNGITFNGDTAAANALDDYEEGTWTPTCASASSVSYSNQYGRYTKVGNCITIWWDLIWTSLSGGNNARIGGLPYTPVVNTNQGGYGIPAFRDASGTNTDNRIYGNSSYFLTDGIRLQHYNSSGNPTSGSFNGSGRITGWAQYFDNNAY